MNKLILIILILIIQTGLFLSHVKFSHGQILTAKKVMDFPGELIGMASYYSRAGCLGCSKTLTMANGESLDDTKLTIALAPNLISEHKLMNKYVGVINIKNHMWVIAKITDTGGFAKLNRIADLSLETKNQLNCSSLCEVIIVF